MTPAELREESVGFFARHAQAFFAKQSRWNTLTLCVGQYYDDEARDAVHSLLVASEDGFRWPHECIADDVDDADQPPSFAREICEYCWPGMEYLSGWDANHTAIRAFEAFCLEGVGQDDDVRDQYLPYAVATRTQEGPRIEVVGEPTRPWLLDWPLPPVAEELAALLEAVYREPASDAPRLVVADWLMEQGDPRGAFIMAQLRGEVGDTALQTRPWSGDLAAVTETPKTIFKRGFPSEVRVHYTTPESVQRWGSVTAWATVESLEFDEGSLPHFGPHLFQLRRVMGLTEDGLIALSHAPCAAAIEDLSLEVLQGRALDALSALPRLEHLNVVTVESTPPSMWSALELCCALTTVEVYLGGQRGVPWMEAAFRLGLRQLVWRTSTALRFEWTLGERLVVAKDGWAYRARDAQRQMISEVFEWLARYAPDTRIEPLPPELQEGSP